MSEPPQSRNAIAQALFAQGEGGSALPEFSVPPIDAYFNIFKITIVSVVVVFALIAISSDRSLRRKLSLHSRFSRWRFWVRSL